MDLSFICDILGVFLAKYRLVYACTGTMSVVIGLLYVLIQAAGKPNLTVGEPWQMFGLVANDATSSWGAGLISPLGNLVYGFVAPPVASPILTATV